MGQHLAFLAAFLFLLAQPMRAEFFAGQSDGKIYVLCEGQKEAFISPPGTDALLLLLNNDSQAQYAIEKPGPHSVQCGREVKTVFATAEQEGVFFPQERPNQTGWALAAFFFLALISLFVALWARAQEGVRFEKRIDGGKVELFVSSQKNLFSVEIDDPQFEGGKIRIPKIGAGKTWRLMYESSAKPSQARMSADSKKGRVTMDARLMANQKAVSLEEGKTRKLAKIKES